MNLCVASRAKIAIARVVSIDFLNSRMVGGTGHYLNRSAEFETSVLGVIRVYTPTLHVSAAEINADDGRGRRSGLDGPAIVKTLQRGIAGP